MDNTIKITKEGWAVVAGDTLLSRYVEEQGRLDVAEGELGPLQRFVPRGGVVVDVGACIGDHTMTYGHWVGDQGMVHAFEPNPVAYRCLCHNMKQSERVKLYNVGLGADFHNGVCTTLDTNHGATYLTRADDGDLSVAPLDVLTGDWARLDFMKIDVEGYEPLVLDGAVQTIKRFRPVMLIEVNQEMLLRQGWDRMDVLNRIAELEYLVSYSPKHSYDLLCVPLERAEVRR